MSGQSPWVFCQLGAREHFVLPAGLHARGRLRALITDRWVRPDSLLAHLPGSLGRRLAERQNPALQTVQIEHFTLSALAGEIHNKLIRPRIDWDKITARNRWFQRRAVDRLHETGLLKSDPKPVVFAYSYAALEILRAAREAGCTTVLGQIDPGIFEEDIVARAVACHPEMRPQWSRAPAEYWAHWRQECALADHIIVNSSWSAHGLREAGIDTSRLSILPLAYAPHREAKQRSYPARFTRERPLRVLFLGSVVIRKGVAELLDAARLLAGEAVRFDLVGGLGISVPETSGSAGNAHLHGAVVRGDVHKWFDQADLFILPTLSDGFGLTLVEAQSHGLPIIASKRCGDVVTHGVNGLVLDDVSGAAIVDAISEYLRSPSLLATHAEAASASVARFKPQQVVDRLLAIVDEGAAVGASQPVHN